MAEASFFDVLKSITNHKYYTWKDVEHLYNPFMINKALSMQESSIFYANECNIKHTSMSNRMQYDFLFHTYHGAKFIKWIKADAEEDRDDIEFLMMHLELSESKVKELLPLYNDEIIKQIKENYNYKG